MNEKVLAIVIKAHDQASKVINSVGSNFEGVSEKIMSTAARVAKYAAAAAAAAGTALGGIAIANASQYEQYRLALETMLGGADQARKMLSDIADFAKKTPFELPGLVEASKQLLAFGVAQDDIIPTLRRLGDIAAGVGVPVGQLSYVYGQVRLTGKLMAQDLMQFTNAGVPLLDYLAKTMNKTAKQIKDDMDRGVGPSFEQVKVAIAAMTDEGGKFHDMMAKQSSSLGGIFSNIKDGFNQILNSAIGMSVTGDIIEGSIYARLKAVAEDAMPAVQRAAESTGQSMIGLIEWLSALNESLAPVYAYLNEMLTPSLLALGRTIRDDLGPAFRDLAPYLKAFAGYVGISIVAALWILINTLNFAIAAVSKFVTTMSNAAESIRNNYDAINKALTSPFVAALGLITSIPGMIVKAFQGLGSLITKAIGSISLPGLKSGIKIPGFASGGFTGPGGANEVAGVVHRGEYVIPKQFVNQSTGQPNVGSTFNMYGTIQINTPEAADRFFDRMNAMKEFAAAGAGV